MAMVEMVVATGETFNKSMNTKKKFYSVKVTLYSAFLIILLQSMTNAQIYFSTSLEGYFDDNIFNNYSNESDFVNTFSGELGHDFESERNNFELYYLGSYNYYNKNVAKTSSFHRFGIVETYLFKEEDNPLNVGLNYSFRQNRDDFSVYDYNQLSGYANYLHSISEGDKLQGGVIFNKIDYENYSLFSYIESKIFLRSITNFDTKTSLILGAELDNKSYSEQTNDPDMAEAVTQSRFMLQIGQALSEQLGISGYGMYRKNLQSGNRYFSIDDFIYYEEEIFNDIYSNEGYETGLNISYLFSKSILGKIETKYQVRNYIDLFAVSADGIDLDYFRKDILYGAGASVEINLVAVMNGLTLYMNYNLLKNESNDFFYDYSNSIYSISFGWDF